MRRLLAISLSALALTATSASLAQATPKPELSADTCIAPPTGSGSTSTATYSEDGKSKACVTTARSQPLGNTGISGGRDQYVAYQTITYYYETVTTKTQAKKNAPIVTTETTTRVVTSDIRQCEDFSAYQGHGIRTFVDLSYCEGLFTF